MLRVETLTSGYGRIAVLHDVSLAVAKGEMVALVGSNGAGKTTLLRAISGVQPINGGTITFDGKPIHTLSPHARVRAGIVQVPEGRQVFAPLAGRRQSAARRVDAQRRRHRARSRRGVRDVPGIGREAAIAAGALSGGQQQMLAIGRALMARPKLLLLDEPSMGLAPMLAEQILANVAALKARGLTVLLVEQRAHAALAIADRAYVLETGRITLSGDSAALRADARVREAYLGM